MNEFGKPENPISDGELVRLMEQLRDENIEHVLVESGSVNEGNNGLIFKLAIPDIANEIGADPTFAEELKQKGLTVEDFIGRETAALKLFKVYDLEVGKKEYEAQKKAYDLIEENPNKDSLAKVPKPLWFHEFPISQETQETLNKRGANIQHNRAAMIMMDFVEGKDLATIFYEWILQKHPDAHLYPPRNSESFPELQASVSKLLNFSAPGEKSSDEGEREFERRKVFAENADKIYTFLRRTGFTLPEGIIDRLRGTFDLLHHAGLYHNDPHERNFMLEFKEGSAHPDIFIIDFGSSGGKMEGRVDDQYIINRLNELGTPVKEDRVRELKETLRAVAKTPSFSNEYEYFLKRLEKGGGALFGELVQSVKDEHFFELFLAKLSRALEDKKISTEEALALISAEQNKKQLPPWVLNRLSLFKKTLG